MTVESVSAPAGQLGSRSTSRISVVFPVFNEEGNLKPLHEEVKQAFLEANVDYEMVFVDNGSTDNSLSIIKELAKRDHRVCYVSLSRNFGHQGGLFAGMSYVSGDACITMDADLQHPPSLIPQMIDLWRQGYEVVYTAKRSTQLSGLTGLQVKIFYRVISKLSGLKLSFGQSDFRLIDRKVIDAIIRIPEYRKFLRGVVHWLGFRQTRLQYDVLERHSGHSKFSYGALLSFALDGILAFSTLPLRFLLGVGVVIAGMAMLYGLTAVVLGVLSLAGAGVQLPPGWATLAAAISFFGAVQLIATGILGEYIGRIYDQTKGRPVFVVTEASANLSSEPSQEAGQITWSKL